MTIQFGGQTIDLISLTANKLLLPTLEPTKLKASVASSVTVITIRFGGQKIDLFS